MYLHFWSIFLLLLFTFTFKSCSCFENGNETVKQATRMCPCGIQYLQRGSARNSTLPIRIKGGRDARPGEYPWVVRMRAVSDSSVGEGNSLDSTCTGALITRQWVLLAAHCFCLRGAVPGPSFFKMVDLKMYIYYGELNRNDDSTKNRMEFTLKNPQMVFFPQTRADLPTGAKRYDFEACEAAGDGGDMALIKLPKPIPMGPKTRQGIVCMPYDIKNDLEDYQERRFKATLPGWGAVFSANGQNMGLAENLKTVQLELTPARDRNCERPAGALCAFSTRKDACGGDSGSSLLIRKPSSGGRAKFYSIGVVSNGPACNGQATSPGIYTFVDSYIQWIQRTLKVNKVPMAVQCN